MNNTETLTTSYTQTQDTINTRVNRRDNQDEQHRDTDNIGYTRQNKHQSKQKGQSTMNNRETLTTSDTQDTGQNKHQGKQKGQSRMNNTETLTTSDIQDTRQNKHQSKQKEQHRDTDNIGYTRHKTK